MKPGNTSPPSTVEFVQHSRFVGRPINPQRAVFRIHKPDDADAGGKVLTDFFPDLTRAVAWRKNLDHQVSRKARVTDGQSIEWDPCCTPIGYVRTSDGIRPTFGDQTRFHRHAAESAREHKPVQNAENAADPDAVTKSRCGHRDDSREPTPVEAPSAGLGSSRNTSADSSLVSAAGVAVVMRQPLGGDSLNSIAHQR